MKKKSSVEVSSYTRLVLKEALDRAKTFVNQEKNHVREYTEKLNHHQKVLDGQLAIVKEISAFLGLGQSKKVEP